MRAGYASTVIQESLKHVKKMAIKKKYRTAWRASAWEHSLARPVPISWCAECCQSFWHQSEVWITKTVWNWSGKTVSKEALHAVTCFIKFYFANTFFQVWKNLHIITDTADTKEIYNARLDDPYIPLKSIARLRLNFSALNYYLCKRNCFDSSTCALHDEPTENAKHYFLTLSQFRRFP